MAPAHYNDTVRTSRFPWDRHSQLADKGQLQPEGYRDHFRTQLLGTMPRLCTHILNCLPRFYSARLSSFWDMM